MTVAEAHSIPGGVVPTIAIRIHCLAQLFDTLDPSPLRQRTLDYDAERYILSSASEYSPSEPLRLLIFLPESLRTQVAEVADGIHEHFRLAHAQGERRYRRRMRIAAISLGAGLLVLAISLGLRNLLSDVVGRGLAAGLAEGLLIIGWVAMWRPIEILLYEHWESHLGHAETDRLSRIPVDYSFLSDAESSSVIRSGRQPPLMGKE